ncbi:MAG: hypothetical protein Kow0065_10190 [Methylomicrobium sp.]
MRQQDIYQVLLVEDDPGDANLVRHYLKAARDVGFECTWAMSLADACRQLHDHRFDILLVDLSLPDSRGLDTVRAVRAAAGSLPLIVLTGHDDTGFALDTLESGAQDYLVKGDFDSGGLIRCIRYALSRAKLEQRLQEAEERWRFALEGSGSGVWDWDLTTDQVLYSKRWKEVLGFDDNEIGCGLDEWLKRLHPDDLSQALDEVRKHIDGKTTRFHGEYRLLSKDGEWRWVSGRGMIVDRDDDGRPLRMIGTMTDISERKELEQALHESRQFAISTIDALSAHICVIDATGTIMAVNRAWRDFYLNEAGEGVCPAAVGTNYLSICESATGDGADEALKMARGIRSVIEGKRDTFMMELPCHTAEKQQWFNARITRFQDDGCYFVVAHENITDRKLAENRDRLLVAALEAVGHGVVITDIEARIEWANPAFGELTGYKLEEVLGRTPAELSKSGKQSGAFYDNLWNTIRAGRTWYGELINKRKDGTLYDEELTIAPVTDQDGNIAHFVGIKHDISERKRLEEKLRRLATTDELTGLPNRRYFMERLAEQLARTQRHNNHQVAVLMLDLDYFKKINDRYGHALGDRVLKHFAAIMRKQLRKIDTVGRLGGEEFAIFMPDTDLAAAGIFAERLRQQVAELPLSTDTQTVDVTVSIGIALLKSDDAQPDAVLIRADQALYRAKENGRNRVEYNDS